VDEQKEKKLKSMHLVSVVLHSPERQSSLICVFTKVKINEKDEHQFQHEQDGFLSN